MLKNVLSDSGEQPPVATILVLVVSAIIAVIGGIVVIVHPESLDFKEYIDAMEKVVIGGGILAIGRGVLGGARANAPEVEPLTPDFADDGAEGEYAGGGLKAGERPPTV